MDIVIYSLIALFGIVWLITDVIVRKKFHRTSYPDVVTENFYYPDYCDRYPRKNVSFYSGMNRLEGYIYGEENTLVEGCEVFGKWS